MSLRRNERDQNARIGTHQRPERTGRQWPPVQRRWSLMDTYLVAGLVAGSAVLCVVVWLLAKIGHALIKVAEALAAGDQAYERGAWANRITDAEAGVGYVFGEGIREPLRVRAGWVPDQTIKALEAFVTASAPQDSALRALPATASTPGCTA